MERLPPHLLAPIMEYLGLKDMESLAVASSALCRDVLQDPCYHRRIDRFLCQLEKQVWFLERRSFVSRDVVMTVTAKYNSLRSYYDGFTNHSGTTIPFEASRLKLLFPT